MRWLTLCDRIGKIPIRVTRQRDIYALLYDQKSRTYTKRWLMLKYDAHGNPYFIEDTACTAKHEKQNNEKFHKNERSENP
jgi:hypothetical protein